MGVCSCGGHQRLVVEFLVVKVRPRMDHLDVGLDFVVGTKDVVVVRPETYPADAPHELDHIHLGRQFVKSLKVFPDQRVWADVDEVSGFGRFAQQAAECSQGGPVSRQLDQLIDDGRLDFVVRSGQVSRDVGVADKAVVVVAAQRAVKEIVGRVGISAVRLQFFLVVLGLVGMETQRTL